MPGLSVRLKRLAISAFLVVHVGGVVIWNLPGGAIRSKLIPYYAYYFLPMGLWQNWGMFAPDPLRHTILLEAVATDSRGMVYAYEFTKMLDLGPWDRFLKVRHSKYSSYLTSEDYSINRLTAAKHAVRQLEIPADAFPVDLELQFRVYHSPPPGKAPDPTASPVVQSIKHYRFPSREDVQP